MCVYIYIYISLLVPLKYAKLSEKTKSKKKTPNIYTNLNSPNGHLWIKKKKKNICRRKERTYGSPVHVDVVPNNNAFYFFF